MTSVPPWIGTASGRSAFSWSASSRLRGVKTSTPESLTRSTRDNPAVLVITVGPLGFRARLERETAPRTCEALLRRLPIEGKLLQARWSGEAAWLPLGDLDLGLEHENHNSYPAAGELLLYPGGLSETEILFPYGATSFASRVGPLAGNHFATVEDGRELLVELGRLVVWEGAQDIRIEAG